MKKGLTLIELIVVIGIIAVLATVLFGAFSGSLESARAARCLTNLKNLASAVQMTAKNNGLGTLEYPRAGSIETFRCDADGIEEYTDKWSKGWISWDSRNKYPSKSSQAGAGMTISMYEKDEERRLYALTNGAIWKATGCNHSIYLCPSHVNALSDYSPNYSYVMNAAFGWSPNPGQDLDVTGTGGGVTLSARADRRLLFAEIEFTAPSSSSSAYDYDAILQYKDCTEDGSYSERIGFNHKSGKHSCANIVFQDGHVEKLLDPKDSLSRSNIEELTKWLCEAEDVSLDGSKYIKLED